MSNKVILGYWGFQGLGQVPRLLMEYLHVPYENKYYIDKEQWAKDKEELGLDFPNLPYIIDGDYKLSESAAILKWIAYKGKNSQVLGGNEKESIAVEMLLGVIQDLRKSFSTIKNAPKENGEEIMKAEYAKINAKLTYLSKFLDEKDWLLGYLTVADFGLVFVLDIFHLVKKELLDGFKNLAALRERFYEIPEIKAFKASDRCPEKLFS